jgi:hypothetical protein
MASAATVLIVRRLDTHTAAATPAAKSEGSYQRRAHRVGDLVVPCGRRTLVYVAQGVQ